MMRVDLGDLACVLTGLGGNGLLLRVGGREARKTCVSGKEDVAGGELTCAVTWLAMIAAVAFHAAAVGVDGVDLRKVSAERISRLEKDSAIAENVGGQCTAGGIE